MASSARIDELRKKFDENPRRYFAPLANEYRKAGDLEQAIFICQEYLPQQPGHMSGHIVYGQALYEQGRFEEARQVFETALSLDPENLIALRHLGDIARQLGDSRAARTWYQRVLEADPRNEEIAQIMMSLLSTPPIQQTSIESAPTPALPTPALPQASIESTRPTSPTGFQATDSTFQVEKSGDDTGLSVGPALTSLPERQTPMLTPAQSAAAAARLPEHELLDLNDYDFSVGGVQLSALGTNPSIDQPPSDETPSDEQPVEESFVDDEPFLESSAAFVVDAAPAFVADSSFSPPRTEEPNSAPPVRPSEPEVVIEEDDPPFEADPFAIAAAPARPTEELGTDINLGLPDDGTEPALADPNDESLLGLETFEQGFVLETSEEEPASSLDFASFFSAPPNEPEPAEAEFETFEQTETFAMGGIGAGAPTPADPDDAASTDAFTLDEIEGADPTPSFARDQDDGLSSFARDQDDGLSSFARDQDVSLSSFARDQDVSLSSFALTEDDNKSTFASELEKPTLDIEAQPEPTAFAEFDTPIVNDVLPESDAFSIFEPVDAIETPAPPVEEAFPRWDDILPPDAEPEAARPMEPVAEPVAETAAESLPLESPEPQAFVTETMAELYLQQGHLEPALEIYQQLVDQRPQDAQLRDRLRVIEDEVRGRSPDDEPVHHEPAAPEAPAASVFSGPTIREFLASLVWGGGAAATPEQDFADHESLPAVDELSSIDEDFSIPLPAPSHAPEPSARSRGTPVSSETVSGSIDALFSGADASSTDASAATTLAQAFAAETPEPTPLQGMPAHAASSELSLDHVFKTGQSPRQGAESDGFSFDQFFADEMSEGGGKPTDTPAAPNQGGDDIAQFNNWLNGLKKS